MKVVLFVILSGIALSVSSDPICTTGPMWSYCPSSAVGPARWSTLSPEFAACSGTTGVNQSPIRLPSTQRLNSTLGPLVMEYHAMPITVTNNSHSIKVPLPAAEQERQYVLLGPSRVKYKLKEFHFHVPAEHSVVPNLRPVGELHLVHEGPGGTALAIGVLLVHSNTDNPSLGPILDAIPHTPLCGAKEGGQLNLPALVGVLEPRSFIYYDGSLTTPKCTRVRWFIVPTPIPISDRQLKVLNVFGENARPLQNTAVQTYCWPASATCVAK